MHIISTLEIYNGRIVKYVILNIQKQFSTKNSLEELVCLTGFKLLLRYYRHVSTVESLL